MSEYEPSKQDLTLFGTLTMNELNSLKGLDSGSLTLASLRGALRFFVNAGAIKKSWLEKQDIVAETGLDSESIDEKIREVLVPYVGENGNTENLVQTLERIIAERGNVKRNREGK